MKKLNVLLIGLFTIAMMVSCSKSNPITSINTTQTTTTATAITPCVPTQTWTLWAGQTINAGTLTVSNDETNLYVTYTSNSITFGTLHLWVGTDMANIPENGPGIPEPGHFPYKYDASGLTTYTFTIPLANISFYTGCGTKLYVLAHAEWGTETAFGGDKFVKDPRWYYYAVYTVCCNFSNTSHLGTAFAKGGWIFTTDPKSNPEKLPSLNLTNNRWGWAINLKTIGSSDFNLWVGAGLNKTSNGILAGTVNVSWDGTIATVTYNLKPGYSMEEAHVYAGDFKPTTVAPGQYGNTYYFDPFVSVFPGTYGVIDTNGDGIWLIVHASVYGPTVVNI